MGFIKLVFLLNDAHKLLAVQLSLRIIIFIVIDIALDVGLSEIVTTRLPASCSTHAVPPLLRFPSSCLVSLTRPPHVGLIFLVSLPRVRLVVASPPHVYKLSCFVE